MNKYKIRSIVDWIRGQGRLPRDAYGQILSVKELMGWFGLTERLSRDERASMREELGAMIEAELALEAFELSEVLR